MRFLELPKAECFYIDTSVILAHIEGNKHQHHLNSLMFFNELEKGKITGIVTTLAVLELIDVTKRALALKRDHSPDPKELESLKEKVYDMFKKFGLTIIEFETCLSTSHTSVTPSDRLYEFMINWPAYLQRTYESAIKWRTVGVLDAIHVCLAERLGADSIVTTDDGFKKVKSKVKHVILQETYK